MDTHSKAMDSFRVKAWQHQVSLVQCNLLPTHYQQVEQVFVLSNTRLSPLESGTMS
jgi:hypothetical protein